MSIIDGLTAAARAERTLINQPGFCLATVNSYFGGLSSIGAHAGQYPEAIDVWMNDGDHHPGDMNPPRGAVVLWGALTHPRWPGDENFAAGDICLALGNGMIRATDYPRSGVVGTCTIDQRTAQIGRPYLGWQSGFLGYQIQTAATRFNPTPATDPEEDDDMATMKGAAYTRSTDKAVVYLLFNEGSGFYVEHTGVAGDYNNSIAQKWGTGSWPVITEAHAKVIKAGLDKVRAAA